MKEIEYVPKNISVENVKVVMDECSGDYKLLLTGSDEEGNITEVVITPLKIVIDCYVGQSGEEDKHE